MKKHERIIERLEQRVKLKYDCWKEATNEENKEIAYARWCEADMILFLARGPVDD